MKEYKIEKIDDVEFYNLLEMVRQNWNEQVRNMTDYELMEDRNEWIKHFGISDEDTDDMKLHTDIHTISIMLEQIRRFGGVVYDI